MTKKNDKNLYFVHFVEKIERSKKINCWSTVFVCDECVELCMDIIKEDNKNNKSKIKKDIPKPSQINNI